MGTITGSRALFIDKWAARLSIEDRAKFDEDLRRFVHMQILLIVRLKPKDLMLTEMDLPAGAFDFSDHATKENLDLWNL
jgi:hypothetical protein